MNDESIQSPVYDRVLLDRRPELVPVERGGRIAGELDQLDKLVSLLGEDIAGLHDRIGSVLGEIYDADATTEATPDLARGASPTAARIRETAMRVANLRAVVQSIRERVDL